VDADSFNLSLSDHGQTVTARMVIADDGAPIDFHTNDRFCVDPAHPGQLLRAHWSTPIAGWETVDGHRLPTSGQAVWHFPEGAFAYADFRLIPGSLAYNVPPGA
jgi:hypothetical protein